MTRHDEILRIMRDDYISRLENWDDLTRRERRELRRMKKNYYAELSDPELVLTVPGPGWEIEGPLDITPFVEQAENDKESGIGDDRLEFIKKYREGDELYWFKSDKVSWSYLRGIGGYVIIRGNKVLSEIGIRMN